MQFFVCCSAAFGTDDLRTAERANVAAQLLQRNFLRVARLQNELAQNILLEARIFL